jgi:outer membrane protein, heavy metal efflux system
MRLLILSVVVAIVPLTLAGCYSSSYDEEYGKMLSLERSNYAIENQSDTLPVLGKGSTLSDYVKYAALNNRGLKASFYRWKASLEMVPQVTSLSDPVFTYTNFIDEVETRVGPQENGFAISQKFPFFGKLSAKGNLAMQDANAAYQALQAKLLEVAFEVKSAYYEHYYLMQALRLTEENCELLSGFEKVAASRFRNKLATQQDLLRAQVELGKISNRLATLKELKPAIVAKLNAVLNLSADEPLPTPKDYSGLNKKFAAEDIIGRAIEHSPKLKELAHRISKAQEAKKLAKLNYYPDLTVGADYIDTDNALMSNIPDSGKDPLMLRLSINLPIWQARLNATVRQADAEEKRAELLRSQFIYNLRADLKMVTYRLSDARRQAQLYRDSLIPKARQAMLVAQADYRDGKGNFLSLVDSQRVLLSFQLTYYRSVSNYRQRLAEIEMIVGAPLKEIK